MVATCKIYYIMLAFADLGVLYFFALPEWTGDGLRALTEDGFQIWPEKFSTFTCRLLRYGYHVSGFLSYCTLVIYEYERVLAIAFPFMRFKWISKGKAKIVCLCLTLLTLVFFQSCIFYTCVHN